MPSTHERTSAELKATAVRRYLDEGVQASEICDELDISPREFRQWQRQVHEQELERRDARIAALKAELERRGWLEDGGGETETPADTSSTPSDAPTRSLSPPRAPGTPTHDLRGSSSPDLDPSPSSEWSATVPLAPSIGALLGPYVINDTLGQGGMGRVYRAFDRRLNRNVALKVLHDDLDLHEHGRLVREAQAMAQLTHPNVVQVYEVGEHR
ncbi:MAG: transposase, partial [Nannocystaceae bacterium]